MHEFELMEREQFVFITCLSSSPFTWCRRCCCWVDLHAGAPPNFLNSYTLFPIPIFSTSQNDRLPTRPRWFADRERTEQSRDPNRHALSEAHFVHYGQRFAAISFDDLRVFLSSAATPFLLVALSTWIGGQIAGGVKLIVRWRCKYHLWRENHFSTSWHSGKWGRRNRLLLALGVMMTMSTTGTFPTIGSFLITV